MARIRTVKPEFWKHEDLSSLPEATHLLAAALLNYADDDGYFNANPKLIQAECCPLRDPSVTVHDSLKHLARIGYIRLGTGEDGKRYGVIATFAEHQVINRPKPSKIKVMPIVWDEADTNHGCVTDPSPPEGNREQGTGKGTGKGVVLAPVGAPPAEQDDHFEIPVTLDRSDAAEAVRRWNGMADRIGLPRCQKLTDARKRLLAARLRDCGGLDGWDVALAKVEASSFLRGERNGDGHTKWRADIDFVLKERAFTRLMEGVFDDRGQGADDAKWRREIEEAMNAAA